MDTQRLETSDDITAAIAGLADSALRSLMLYVPRPDDALWSSPALVDALRGFLTARSQREVQWLFGAVDGLARDHGALIALAQRLPSLLQLRQSEPDFAAPAAQAFIANDRGQMLLFDSGERLAATLTGAGDRVRPLVARFSDAWERARPLAELRTLGI